MLPEVGVDHSRSAREKGNRPLGEVFEIMEPFRIGENQCAAPQTRIPEDMAYSKQRVESPYSRICMEADDHDFVEHLIDRSRHHVVAQIIQRTPDFHDRPGWPANTAEEFKR
jgi:hypothetical protein